jgi:hypothetical protein
MAENEFAGDLIDELLAEALASLPDNLKSVTKLSYDGLSYEEIGQQLVTGPRFLTHLEC